MVLQLLVASTARVHRRRVHRVWSVGSDEIACVHGGSLKHIPMGIEEWELDPHCPLPRPPHPSLGFPPASLSLLPSEGLPWDAKSVVELPIGPLSASPKKMMLSEPAEYFTVTCRPIYERMVITPASEPEAVDALKASLQPGVALLCYDYKTFSAQEILGHMKHILQPPSPELTSIAVMAYPGSNVSVAISADVQLSKEGLEDRRTGVAAFWKALSGFVHCQGYIALLDCGLLQDPDRGAGLLRALQSLTHIRHAASDNAVAGYPLHVLSAKGELEATTILALEEHFDPHQYHHNFMPGATHGNVDSADP
uniref:Uncharacterized protein n=1 Tax=Tetraselmis sp. GSL018 TaxID=582737 RepID=A0A061RS34_9CHLO